jgi:hypothetical protein
MSVLLQSQYEIKQLMEISQFCDSQKSKTKKQFRKGGCDNLFWSFRHAVPTCIVTEFHY